MTIPFGRRRLILTLAPATPPSPLAAAEIPVDASDAELVRMVRNARIDVDRARWDGLTLLYGGLRRR